MHRVGVDLWQPRVPAYTAAPVLCKADTQRAATTLRSTGQRHSTKLCQQLPQPRHLGHRTPSDPRGSGTETDCW